MWKSVKLHFSVNTIILDFLKVSSLFLGFRNQFCFQILTLEFENTVLSKKRNLNFSEVVLPLRKQVHGLLQDFHLIVRNLVAIFRPKQFFFFFTKNL